ncbi:MAG TPA: hypothetical protein VK559_13075 [Ferruginibacter sp.]|nr:hypothetical protein [Ferruginibacter sp.]
MTEIDNRYRRQLIENFDLDLPYINLSFFDNLSVIKTSIFIFLIAALITPFLPPRYGAYKWTLPTSWDDYYERSKNVLILAVVIVVLVLVSDILSNIRTFIDRRLGYKKVGVFKVTNVWNLLTKKIVFLNNLHFLTLRQKDYGFDEIEVGQTVEIERSATHKFLDYQITKQ